MAHTFFYASAVSATVILTRILWVFPAAYLPRLLSASFARVILSRMAARRHRGLVGNARRCLSGGSSSASHHGRRRSALPGRNEIIFLSFSVILVTLVFQGLTLPFSSGHGALRMTANRIAKSVGSPTCKSGCPCLCRGARRKPW